MRLRVALLLIALALAPFASAGSARDPEVKDAADLPRMTAADVTAAWVRGEKDGLRVTLQTVDGSRPEQFPDFVYWLYFEIDATRTQVGAALGFGDDGELRSFLGTGPDGGLNDPRIWRGGFEDVANGRLRDLQEERGRPSRWSGLIPWGSVDGLEVGAELDDFVAGSARYQRQTGTWQGGIDRAESDAVYVAAIEVSGPLGEVLPILVPAWMIPAIVVACAAAGLGAGAALARATRPKPRAAAPVRVPVLEQARPPGERFRVAPRR